MPVKIERIEKSEIDAVIATTPAGFDPELVELIRSLPIGEGFKVTPETGDTDRKTKRRVNSCAKEAGKELGWRPYNGALLAYVKATLPVTTPANGTVETPAEVPEVATGKKNGK